MRYDHEVVSSELPVKSLLTRRQRCEAMESQRDSLDQRLVGAPIWLAQLTERVSVTRVVTRVLDKRSSRAGSELPTTNPTSKRSNRTNSWMEVGRGPLTTEQPRSMTKRWSRLFGQKQRFGHDEERTGCGRPISGRPISA